MVPTCLLASRSYRSGGQTIELMREPPVDRTNDKGEVTVSLEQSAGGNPSALGGFVPMVYQQLHGVVPHPLSAEARRHTPGTTLMSDGVLPRGRLNQASSDA
ncbi:MAG: hypothetical protein BMS9Abin29_1196 [Gemmatimonadota bacterium]|nr:MAG: hypothetical protein BMS9Abin29_1196 [Gemmatimonadota bacterium]